MWGHSVSQLKSYIRSFRRVRKSVTIFLNMENATGESTCTDALGRQGTGKTQRLNDASYKSSSAKRTNYSGDDLDAPLGKSEGVLQAKFTSNMRARQSLLRTKINSTRQFGQKFTENDSI